MLSKLIISQVIESQLERLRAGENDLLRYKGEFDSLDSHALIITGIRRCGKSTLLQQIHRSYIGESVFLNLEDPRLTGFDVNDFNRLHELALEKNVSAYFFDEIQNVDKWESFVRFSLDENYRVFITGSNASMLSRELGTKLTGRHISRELFPFSYSEYLNFSGLKRGETSSLDYLKRGGFPEYIKRERPEIIMQAFNDIIIRDIAVRYGLRNTKALQQLAIWLVSNIGKRFTGNRLKKIVHISSSSSMMEYLAYFEEAYLFFYVPIFSYSYKVQRVNPRKVYCIDNSFVDINSVSFSEDKGPLLENMVFLKLRRNNLDIFYFTDKGECDFAVFEKGKIKGLYQVCWQLDQDNSEREVYGLMEAMEFFDLGKAIIITLNQKETFIKEEKTIEVLPYHEWDHIIKCH
jgi:predicted AAA+ superfamily ATPase